MEWENFWLYGARTFLKNQGNVNRCLSNLKKAFVIYKEDHDRSRWPIFIERIREDKDFKTILNDAHFKEALLSASLVISICGLIPVVVFIPWAIQSLRKRDHFWPR